MHNGGSTPVAAGVQSSRGHNHKGRSKEKENPHTWAYTTDSRHTKKTQTHCTDAVMPTLANTLAEAAQWSDKYRRKKKRRLTVSRQRGHVILVAQRDATDGVKRQARAATVIIEVVAHIQVILAIKSQVVDE